MVERDVLANIVGIQPRRIENFHQRLSQIAKDFGHDGFRFGPTAFQTALDLENTAFALLFHKFSYERTECTAQRNDERIRKTTEKFPKSASNVVLPFLPHSTDSPFLLAQRKCRIPQITAQDVIPNVLAF